MTPIQSQTYAQHTISPLTTQTSRSLITDQISPLLPQIPSFEYLINDEGRQAEHLRLFELIQRYSERIQKEPSQTTLDPDALHLYEPIRQINLDDLLRRPPHELQIEKKYCCCNESTALKIALIVIGTLFIGAAITCHFMGAHPAAAYSLASVGSLLIASTAMISLIQYLKKSS